MMTSYKYIQKVDFPSLLQDHILAGNLSTPLDHIDTDGSGANMIINIWFSDALSDADQTTLDNILSSYVDPFNTQTYINSITAALATDANVIIVLRMNILQTLPDLTVPQLQMICQVLGLPYA